MREISNQEVDCVDGGWGWVARAGKFIAETAAGEALVAGAKSLANAVGNNGGYPTNGYGDHYYNNIPVAMQ